MLSESAHAQIDLSLKSKINTDLTCSIYKNCYFNCNFVLLSIRTLSIFPRIYKNSRTCYFVSFPAAQTYINGIFMNITHCNQVLLACQHVQIQPTGLHPSIYQIYCCLSSLSFLYFSVTFPFVLNLDASLSSDICKI